VAKVTGEIDAAEAAAGRHRPPAPPRGGRPAGAARRDDRAQRKELANLEKTVARLDAEKKERHAALLSTTDPAEALRLHAALTEVEAKLATAEERWLELQERLSLES
jgi:ATP-binding cassette subfamily F protein 3